VDERFQIRKVFKNLWPETFGLFGVLCDEFGAASNWAWTVHVWVPDREAAAYPMETARTASSFTKLLADPYGLHGRGWRNRRAR
jgi:hypothetical protein